MKPDRTAITLWIVGDGGRPEFQPALDSLAAKSRLVVLRDAAAACARLTAGEDPPAGIIVAQAWPGEVTAESLAPLRRLAPLTPLVALVGSWCEGETRSGSPWPAAMRLYWHQGQRRFADELLRLSDGRLPVWGLPLTSTEDERFLAAGKGVTAGKGVRTLKLMPFGPDTFSSMQGLIAIHANSFDMGDWLAAACQRRGYATVLCQPDRPVRIAGVRAALWEGGCMTPVETARLRQFAASLPGVHVVALLDFPRIEDRQAAMAAGAAAVLSKPILLSDLFGAMEDAKPQTTRPLNARRNENG